MEKNAIAQAAENYSTTPRTVLGNLTNRVAADTQSGVGEMRKSKTLQRAIQQARCKQFGFAEVPKTWEEMIIPDELANTVNGDRFGVMNKPITDENSP